MVPQRVCRSCGYVGSPTEATGMQILIVVLLLLLMVLPGLVYIVYLATKSGKCPKCGSKKMIPVDSPFAKEVLAERSRATASTTPIQPSLLSNRDEYNAWRAGEFRTIAELEAWRRTRLGENRQ